VLVTRLFGRDPVLATEDALRALAALDWTGEAQRPGVVAYLPVFRGNPYQALLYSALPSVGLRSLPIYDASRAVEFTDAVASSGLDVVIHAHWLNVVTTKARDEQEAREFTKSYLDNLQRAKDQGARLLWTVHNILPHESRYPDLDAELRRGLAAIADRIHVMAPDTRDLVAPWYEIPEEKVWVVPHPAYDSVYPSWLPREQARLELGISPETVVFLLIGALKPYKGYTELLEAFDQLSHRDPGKYALLIAGAPDRDEETRRFQERILAHPTVLAALHKIPIEDMQVYLRAADIAVFPYRRSLNSGALALALTFGLPVVLPSHSGEAANVDPTYAELYDAATPNALLDALTKAQRLMRHEARTAAAAAAEKVSARRVAHMFATRVRLWLNDDSSKPPVSLGDDA
jgi:beta-1,4-mannosyltransferase